MSYIVAVTGGSGSGKTYFLHALLEQLGSENICLVSQDNYYRPRTEQPLDENGIENFDTPQSIDFPHFIADVRQLKEGSIVNKQEYTFNNPDKKPKMLVFTPKPLILLEGIFILHDPEIKHMTDLKIFIDAHEHVRITRRIQRDQIQRGYDLEDVLYRYEHHVMPTYEKYIRVHRDDADIIIANNRQGFGKALEVVSGFLKAKIAEHSLAHP